MHLVTSLILCIFAFASMASATQFNVTVGKDTTLSFDPSTLINVQTGDIVTFTFVSQNHSVTQSSFSRPCHARFRGADSGFMPVGLNSAGFPEFTIHIDNTSAPLWFFCAQTGHCQAGMVFAINPTENTTFDDFLATAQRSANSTIPATAPSPTKSFSQALPKFSLRKATSFLLILGFVVSHCNL